MTAILIDKYKRHNIFSWICGRNFYKFISKEVRKIKMYTFIFADDESIIRDKILRLIDWESFGFSCVGSFSNGRTAMEFLKTNHVDLMISDIKMPLVSGLELAKYLYESRINTQIIFLSAYRDFQYAVEAIQYKISAYLTKPISTGDLKRELLKVKQILDAERDEQTTDEYKSVIHMVKEYIDKNYRSNITLESAAEYVNISPNYLSSLFKQKEDIGFSAYITKVRIEKARSLLRDPTLKIYNVCDMVGYKDVSHFYKIFKEYTGCSPNEYRKNNRE